MIEAMLTVLCWLSLIAMPILLIIPLFDRKGKYYDITTKGIFGALFTFLFTVMMLTQ